MPLARYLTVSDLRTDPPADLTSSRLKLIAQGDSWFSINKLFLSTSLLRRLNFSEDSVILSCAYPGDVLTHMVEWRRDPYFFRYFASPNLEEQWDGLLLSAGGNDLIAALAILPEDANGVPNLAAERLLLTKAERASTGPIDRYVSPDGWAKFREHMLEQYRALDSVRAGSAKNRNVPIFTHCYAIPQPRNVGAGLSGPWLYKSLLAYQVPPADWLPLSKHLIDLLHDEIIAAAKLVNYHVLDTRNMIPPASPDPGVRDRYWANEIHPTARGYDLIAAEFVEMIERVLVPAHGGQGRASTPVGGPTPASVAAPGP